MLHVTQPLPVVNGAAFQLHPLAHQATDATINFVGPLAKVNVSVSNYLTARS
eukprot:CAMPEP_0204261158 /NCGR_PEP_ID=MMETSP0468-20130131/6819_1 /ASSEMBLY_ACC=CAM_ASM_000383 /TAXON_ID=2969 /ORGANISM="Oxyrrhis marina" /LENGTH=51 /DNA_ID=CAMNT_0051235673 /DNA_START=997 /DNA_END=1148 /DNA_ORIENTATION=-